MRRSPTSNTVTLDVMAEALTAAVAKLGRFGASYPLYLEPPAGFELHPAVDLFKPSDLGRYCERAILEWTAHPADEDMRAAASRFMRRYCGSLATAALVPLAHGVAFDLSIERISLLIRSDMPMGVVLNLGDQRPFGSPGRPTTFPIQTRPLPTAAALREAALGSLVRDNLVPAFERVLDYVHLNPRVLWATTAEQIDLLVENVGDGHSPDERAAYAEDREAILFGTMLPGVAGPNPLLGTLTWERVDDPTFSRPLQVRQICCVCYVVPGRNAYCRSCVLLPAEERLAMCRSWRASVQAAPAAEADDEIHQAPTTA